VASSGAVQSDIIGTGSQLLILEELDDELRDISEVASVREKT
jgi:hypothetical protein